MKRDIKTLNDELLNMINGGVLTEEILTLIPEAVKVFKENGWSLEELLELAEFSYDDNPLAHSSDGSVKDLNEFLDRIKEEWNRQ